MHEQQTRAFGGRPYLEKQHVVRVNVSWTHRLHALSDNLWSVGNSSENQQPRIHISHPRRIAYKQCTRAKLLP